MPRIINYPTTAQITITDAEHRLVQDLCTVAPLSLMRFLRAQYQLSLREAKGIVDTIKAETRQIPEPVPTTW